MNLAREVPGLIPTEEWKKKRFRQEWNAGETVNVAIGQSYVLATAIQLANAYAAIGNGGTLYRPYLVKEIESYEGEVLKTFHPESLAEFKLHPKTIELVKQGLWGVVNEPARHGLRVAAPGHGFRRQNRLGAGRAPGGRQSGRSARTCTSSERDNALFVGFAPVNDPVIAVAVIAEHACHGASAAAPIARAVIKDLSRKVLPDLYGDKELERAAESKGREPPT